MTGIIKEKLDRFAGEMELLEGRTPDEDKLIVAVDLVVGLLDDIGMVSAASSLRRMEDIHLREQEKALAEKDEEIDTLEKGLTK